jgi:chromosome segregation ATPase
MPNTAKLADNAVDLHNQLAAAQQEIAHKNNRLEQQKAYIGQLEEFIRNLRQKQFGASSEVQNALQVSLLSLIHI